MSERGRKSGFGFIRTRHIPAHCIPPPTGEQARPWPSRGGRGHSLLNWELCLFLPPGRNIFRAICRKQMKSRWKLYHVLESEEEPTSQTKMCRRAVMGQTLLQLCHLPPPPPPPRATRHLSGSGQALGAPRLPVSPQEPLCSPWVDVQGSVLHLSKTPAHGRS